METAESGAALGERGAFAASALPKHAHRRLNGTACALSVVSHLDKDAIGSSSWASAYTTAILLERGEPLGGDGNAAPPDALVD